MFTTSNRWTNIWSWTESSGGRISREFQRIDQDSKTSRSDSASYFWWNVNKGPVHTYPDIFENGAFFLPFLKKSVSTRRVFKSFLPVHDIWRHRFRKPLYGSKKYPVKKSTVWRPFSKSPGFGYQNHNLCVDGSRIRREKLHFQKYFDTCGVHTVFTRFSQISSLLRNV